MARKKTITREQILAAAYDLVAKEGFSKFTARNIAGHMNCSTQPIYLEFKNMDDLKESLFEKIKTYLQEDVYGRVVTGNPLIDMNLNYIQFATDEKKLYRYLYLEEHSEDEELQRFSNELFMKNADSDPHLRGLSQEIKEQIFLATTIVASGVASLKVGNLIDMTQDDIIELFDNVIEGVLAKNQ